jgi:hypothetical protein
MDLMSYIKRLIKLSDSSAGTVHACPAIVADDGGATGLRFYRNRDSSLSSSERAEYLEEGGGNNGTACPSRLFQSFSGGEKGLCFW